MIIQFLKQPCPPFRQKWRIILLVEFCVCFTLFGFLILNESPIYQQNHIVFFINYMFVTTVCSYWVLIFMPLALKEDEWAIWKYLLSALVDIILITSGNIFIEQICIQKYGPHFLLLMHKAHSFFYNLAITFTYNFTLGAVITTVVYFFIKSIELSFQLREKDAMNKQLFLQKMDKSDKIITLSGKTKEQLVLNPENILYIEASGNYVDIHFWEDEKVSRRMLRTTIQQMENVLKVYPTIIRCHRAFIVNISYIEKATSNHHGLLLVLKTIDKEVPVSRTYKKNIPSIPAN